MMKRLALPLPLLIALSGCGAGTAPVSAGANPPPAHSTHNPVERSHSRDNDGDGPLAGRDADALIALFGQPRLDRREGAARVLQFTGRDCTLDTYLYPPRERAEHIVAHVDARRASDGADMDADQCVAALRRR